MANLQLRHESFHRLQKKARFGVSYWLLVEHSSQCREECIKLPGFDDRPWDNNEFTVVQTGYEIGCLFDFHYTLKFKAESVAHVSATRVFVSILLLWTYSFLISTLSESTTS